MDGLPKAGWKGRGDNRQVGVHCVDLGKGTLQGIGIPGERLILCFCFLFCGFIYSWMEPLISNGHKQIIVYDRIRQTLNAYVKPALKQTLLNALIP